MGKSIIQQARGKGSHTYRVRRKAFSIKPKYPTPLVGKLEVVKLVHSAGHSSPLVKLKDEKGETFYNIAANGLYVGQTLSFGGQNNGEIISAEKSDVWYQDCESYRVQVRPHYPSVFNLKDTYRILAVKVSD